MAYAILSARNPTAMAKYWSCSTSSGRDNCHRPGRRARRPRRAAAARPRSAPPAAARHRRGAAQACDHSPAASDAGPDRRADRALAAGARRRPNSRRCASRAGTGSWRSRRRHPRADARCRAAVAAIAHGIKQEARRHELALPHRAGPGPQHAPGVDVLAVDNAQRVDELPAEKGAAPAVIGERRQRGDHRKLAADGGRNWSRCPRARR